MRIVICDSNEQESAFYTNVCRKICDEQEVPIEVKTYSDRNAFLFEMEDETFSYLVSILIVEPENGFEDVPGIVRKEGYDGLLLYLSRSTATERLLEAFDDDAFNYILKGTDQKSISRFYKVFVKALKAAAQLVRQYIVVSCAGEYKQLNINDIHYFEGATGRMINVEYIGGSFKFVSTLQNLEERLCDRGFIRVHRSYLVSVDAVHLLGADAEELTLNDGRKIPVSRNQAALKTALDSRKL